MCHVTFNINFAATPITRGTKAVFATAPTTQQWFQSRSCIEKFDSVAVSHHPAAPLITSCWSDHRIHWNIYVHCLHVALSRHCPTAFAVNTLETWNIIQSKTKASYCCWYANDYLIFSVISLSPVECCAVCSSLPVPVPLLGLSSLPSPILSAPPLELPTVALSVAGSGMLAFAGSLSEFSFSDGSFGCLDELFVLGVCFIAPVFFLLVFKALGLFSTRVRTKYS